MCVRASLSRLLKDECELMVDECELMMWMTMTSVVGSGLCGPADRCWQKSNNAPADPSTCEERKCADMNTGVQDGVVFNEGHVKENCPKIAEGCHVCHEPDSDNDGKMMWRCKARRHCPYLLFHDDDEMLLPRLKSKHTRWNYTGV